MCSGSPLVSCAFIRCCARVPVCLEPGRHESAACCRPIASFLEACSGCPHHLLQRVPVSLLVNTLDNLQHSGLSTHQVQIVLQCCEHDPSAAFLFASLKDMFLYCRKQISHAGLRCAHQGVVRRAYMNLMSYLKRAGSKAENHCWCSRAASALA